MCSQNAHNSVYERFGVNLAGQSCPDYVCPCVYTVERRVSRESEEMYKLLAEHCCILLAEESHKVTQDSRRGETDFTS